MYDDNKRKEMERKNVKRNGIFDYRCILEETIS